MRNCSHRGLWIILHNWVMISGDMRRGHRFPLYYQNLATYTKTIYLDKQNYR